jgi:hypothetical protein
VSHYAIIKLLAAKDARDEYGNCTLCGQFTSENRPNVGHGGFQGDVVDQHAMDCPFRQAVMAVEGADYRKVRYVR